jgi:hypothetical protein
MAHTTRIRNEHDYFEILDEADRLEACLPNLSREERDTLVRLGALIDEYELRQKQYHNEGR